LDPDPSSYLALFILAAAPSTIWLAVLLLVILIICSGLISGSEVAFFGLGPKDLHHLEDETDRSSSTLLKLHERPRTLLATILICNNFINIAIVVVSDFLIRQMLGQDALLFIGDWLYQHLGGLSALQYGNIFNFSITVIGVTFLLVLFGEVAPKIYANINNLRFAKRMAIPLDFLNSIFGPFSRILVGWSNRIEGRLEHNNGNSQASREDIDRAIELSVSEGQNVEQEVDILKGIVKFGDTPAKQIMRSRVDVVALDKMASYHEVMELVRASGYSRIPVFEDDFDSVVGILYAKDLLGHSSEAKDFEWQTLVREGALFVPESKKIDELLREFQQKRTHIAIVVDEYGGSSGLITLEDVMEEVVGDIKDEFDELEDIEYVQIGPGNFVFEGKSMVNDVCKVIGKDTTYFDEIRGEADSLAGLILEGTGAIPKPERKIIYKDIEFKIVSVTKRRIEKINVKITRT
jgi:gliding motility-associated protein GldE